MLRHDGVAYTDYVEQLSYLLFLKMASEGNLEVAGKRAWAQLQGMPDDAVLETYQNVLDGLAESPGVAGEVFRGALSHFARVDSFRRVMALIDELEWSRLDLDVQGAAFEGLLDRAASEGRKGAGQYFTPRFLIETIVECIQPNPLAHRNFTISDPACGTGGFLVAAREWFNASVMAGSHGDQIDAHTLRRLRSDTYFGQELVARPRKLALMNLLLHDVEPNIYLGDSIYDSPGRRRYDVVLTNPPFGTRGGRPPHRPEFEVATSNKQLNFLQHVFAILKPSGRAAVVLPDNAIFTKQGSELLSHLAKSANLHTLLRCPNGSFAPYAEGVKTNVLFMATGSPTKEMWVYDARSGVPKGVRGEVGVAGAQLSEFVTCYGTDPEGRSRRAESDAHSGRWRSFSVDEMAQIDFNLDALAGGSGAELDAARQVDEIRSSLDAAVTDLNTALSRLQELRTALGRLA